ncbi:hypothetical protein [Nocardioides perillae]|uniref:MT0933-like antitoxin protein n=1 Tax=Nocardioides perillae TaxID=1119534 RepID=A0A7Y9USL1_9ACTN|nr:hypothetical protein [Nocardioides perillae]NYG55979.1 hypothetical protein [Nocardioides perillae]
MGIFKKAGALGVAKMVIDEARKPENQARIKKAVDTAKTEVAKRQQKKR